MHVLSNSFAVPVIRASFARQARRCIAFLALVALAWPSLGPLPYVVHDFDVHFHADTHRGAHPSPAHFDASTIPGSPLHPADHDCPECQVLKHLSRCMPSVIAVVIRTPVVVAIETPEPAVAIHDAQAPAHLPPVRAPPQTLA